VEVALEAPAGGVAGLDEPRPRGGELVARIGPATTERYCPARTRRAISPATPS